MQTSRPKISGTLTLFGCLFTTLAIVLNGGFLHAQSVNPAPAPARPSDPSYVRNPAMAWRLTSSEQQYSTIDGDHLKQYVGDLTAISRRYRDSGHQFWGRIIGTEADAENARWLLEKFQQAGLSDVKEQPFDLPPQWMPQSWAVSASGSGKTLQLESAQPTYRSEGTAPEGLDLEAVDAGLATEADLSGRDLHGKAVFFFSMDFMSRHSTISQGAVQRISDHGAAAIFIVLMIPGNLHFQFYPVGSKVPTFALGLQDGLEVRELMGQSRGSAAPRIKIRMDLKMVPNLKTATIWGTLPGASDENVIIVAHRDAWFEGANDNGTGVATLVGLAEYFSRIPKEQRRRTIIFLGTSGHHDGTAESGTWLAQHKELFTKTALLINCEHTAGDLLISYNGAIRKTNVPSPLLWYVGGSSRLEEIAVKAYDSFGVPTYPESERAAAGEIGRYSQFAPALQVIDTGLYWHSDHETVDVISAQGLGALTRAYAKIITDIDQLTLAELQRQQTRSANK